MPIEKKIIQQLQKRKQTLSLAESCTGGLTAHKLTNISGSSDAFMGGFITYSNLSKQKLLKVPLKILKKHGAVSEPVAKLMAQNVRRIFKTHYGIGITGIAGPTGGTKTKPVGLVYIAVCTPLKTLCVKFQFKGSRIQIKNKAATKALKMINDEL